MAIAGVGSPRTALQRLLTGRNDGAPPWVRALAEPGDPGWFGPGSTIWAVHADAASLVGGIRALLVQAMHPTVLAGFDEHSDYQEDPIDRLQRTAAFVTITTFGTTRQAEAACERVRRVHRRVCGTLESGEPYDASDPELAGWVHLALVDSLADSVRRYGKTRFELDTYLAESAVVGDALDAAWVPRSRADLRRSYDHYLPSLAVTSATFTAHRFILDAPLPRPMRPAYRVLASAAVASLPAELARFMAVRPALPAAPAAVVGRAATRMLALMLGESPAAAAAARRAEAS